MSILQLNSARENGVTASAELSQIESIEQLVAGAHCALTISNDSDFSQWPSDLSALAMLTIEVKDFANGRYYSLVRQLKNNSSFTGTIRITGDIILDQLQYLQRLGVDEVELDVAHDLAQQWQQHAVPFEAHYQSAGTLSSVANSKFNHQAVS